MCFELVKILQNEVAPNVFTPRGAYDGRKNLFSSQRYAFGENDTATVRHAEPHLYVFMLSVTCSSMSYRTP